MTHNLKKSVLFVISILMVSAVFAGSGNPIPSFNFHLRNSATFSENNSATLGQNVEKRDMNVSNNTPGGHRPGGFGSNNIIVIIYRLDYSIVHGPFIVPAGETLTVPIDGHKWGVFVYSTHPTVISVWTNKDL